MMFTMGGGGAALNYKVLDGTAAPENPRVNTVWVNTETEITDHVFSLEEPAKAEGRVWIQTVTASTVAFSVLKNNTVMVYPTAAKQCIGGEWQNVPFQVWQGSAWKEPHTYLFKAGDHCTDITGGWSDAPYNAQTLSFYRTGEGDGTAVISTCTRKPLDLAAFTRLQVNVESYSEEFYVRVKDDAGTIAAEMEAAAPGIVPLDVSGLSGAYYVEFAASSRAMGGYYTVAFEVTAVWLS